MRQGRSILLLGFCFSAGVRATLPQHGFQDVDGMTKAYHFSKYVQGRLFSLQSLIPSWGGLCTKQIYWKGSGDCRIVENNRQQRRMTPSWPSPRSPLSRGRTSLPSAIHPTVCTLIVASLRKCSPFTQCHHLALFGRRSLICFFCKHFYIVLYSFYCIGQQK